MQQRISFITIGAKNLAALKQFYVEKFGWKPIDDNNGHIVFFNMNGFILALFPEGELAEDANVPQDGSGFKKFTLAINYASEKEVDAVFTNLRSKGVTVLKPPVKVSWGGYSGYVADIEGNLWEFAYNPYIELDDKGNVAGHK